MLIFTMKMDRPAQKNVTPETVTLRFQNPLGEPGQDIEGKIHFLSCSESGRARIGFEMPDCVEILRCQLIEKLAQGTLDVIDANNG